MQGLLEDAEHSLNIARTVGRLSTLTQEINKYLIIEQYNVDRMMEKHLDIINEIKSLNPEFDIEVHRDRIMKIMGY